MTTPTGNLISSIKQRKDVEIRSFVIWLVLTLITAALADIIGARSSKFDPSILTLIPFPAALMVYTGLKVDRAIRVLEVYSDGFILRDSKTNKTLHEALWTEARDITLSGESKTFNPILIGAFLFGLLGGLIAYLMTPESASEDATDIVIHLTNKRRIKIDISYCDPTRPHTDLRHAVTKVWLDEATKALKSGQSIMYNNIELMPTGLRKGSKRADWESIQELSYISETGKTQILYRDAAKGGQSKIHVPGSLRGKVLIQIVTMFLHKQKRSPFFS